MLPIQGFGAPGAVPDYTELQKALTTGYTFGATDQVNGAALRVESLEASLRTLTYTDQHIRFWKNIPKMQAFSTVEEYNTLSAYGSNASAFVPEGVLPETEDSNYARKVALVKYLGTTRTVSHQSTLVKSANGDVISLENRNGILFLMRQIEQNLFWGNNQLTFNYSASSGGNEGIEWAGLDAQINAGSNTNYIDAKGNGLSEGILQDAAETVAANYGAANTVYGGYKPISDFSKTYFSKERVIMPTATGGFTAGAQATAFQSQYGNISLESDIFLTNQRKATNNAGSAPAGPTAASSPQAPQTPASVTGTVANSTGVWKSTQVSYYKVTAVNRFGESAATAASAGVTIAATTDVITLTITNASPISGLLPDYYNVYRSDDGGVTFWYIDSVATTSQSSAGTTTYADAGLYMTNVQTVFVGELDPNIIAVKQLAPLMKMDLAVLGPALRWMILFYAVPVLYQPLKFTKIINVGNIS